MTDDTMLQEAVEALRQGNRAQAKELLTQLIKAEQSNATYWIWMSAAVETTKERIYCLQTALRLEPDNATVKRGLVLLGALPPDETTQPFPLNRPRLWEEELAAADAAQKPRGFKAVTSSPAGRLAGLIVIGIAVCGLAVFGLVTPRGMSFIFRGTPGPSPTFTSTPTYINAPAGTPTFAGPTPLWMLLPVTYTPTPLYVSTPHKVESRDIFNAAQAAYRQGDWQAMINFMQQVTTLEPEAADPYYYIGEGYRFMGKYTKAIEAYEQALAINPDFGAAYLGRARATYSIDPDANVLRDFDRAIEKDANFTEAYLERAAYFLAERKFQQALVDLETAKRLSPASPQVYLYLAQAYLASGEDTQALEAAKEANKLDKTMLPAYLVLGQVYEASGQHVEAVGALQAYALYQPEDVDALVILGSAYYATGDYQAAVETLGRSLKHKRVGKAYLYRGLAYLGLEDGTSAEKDLRTALSYFPKSFEASIGLARAYFLQEHYGSAYQQSESAYSLVETNTEMAQVYYWRALSLEQLNILPAALHDWEALLTLPKAATTAEMRQEAEQHIRVLRPPTPSPTSSPTKRLSITPTPGGKKTPTP